MLQVLKTVRSCTESVSIEDQGGSSVHNTDCLPCSSMLSSNVPCPSVPPKFMIIYHNKSEVWVCATEPVPLSTDRNVPIYATRCLSFKISNSTVVAENIPDLEMLAERKLQDQPTNLKQDEEASAQVLTKQVRNRAIKNLQHSTFQQIGTLFKQLIHSEDGAGCA